MKKIIAAVVLSVITMPCWATAQAPDYLMYQGKKLRLLANPLETLFDQFKEMRPTIEVSSTANWRGYVATFSIDSNKLSVSDIKTRTRDPEDEHHHPYVSVLLSTFPEPSDREMSWYSGLLISPLGDLTEYVHFSYASTYEDYLLIRVVCGAVVEMVEMSGDEFQLYKRRVFQEYKQTDEYEKQYAEYSKYSKSEEDFDPEGFIFVMGEFMGKISVPFH